MPDNEVQTGVPTATAATTGAGVRVLIVDNDAAHAEAIAESLERVGYRPTVATSGKAGAELIKSDAFEVIITDLVMNDLDGMAILALSKQEAPDAEVILVTGHGTVPSAVQAMQQGAFHYLLKPLDLRELRVVVDRASASVRLRQDNAELKRRLDEKFGFEQIIGSSPPIKDLISRLQRVAPTDASILILGDTGTGKELVAQAVHQNSPRKNRPFVALNCGALTGNILESELFGHIKGAYTDATSDRAGKFEYANGGTLFLDEVGEMPLSTQVKLLRVMEDGRVTRLGSNETIQVNVRILSATNRNLEQAIEANEFRRDLYYRLKVVTVRLPRLVERGQDITLLIDYFIKEQSRAHHKSIKKMTTLARRALTAHDWPGNVRELRNVIESMIVVDGDGVLDVDDLPQDFAPPPEAPPETGEGGLRSLVGQPLTELEKRFIIETLSACGGNREEAAVMLGIGERTLYRKIREYGL